MDDKLILIKTVSNVGNKVSDLQKGTMGVEIILDATKTLEEYFNHTELDHETFLAFSNIFSSIQQILSQKE